MHAEHSLRERLLSLLVQVGDGDARSKAAVVGVLRREEGRRLRRKVVERNCRHTIVDSSNDLLRNEGGIDVLRVKAVAELLDAGRDLVKCHGLRLSVALNDQHDGDEACGHGRQCHRERKLPRTALAWWMAPEKHMLRTCASRSAGRRAGGRFAMTTARGWVAQGRQGHGGRRPLRASCAPLCVGASQRARRVVKNGDNRGVPCRSGTVPNEKRHRTPKTTRRRFVVVVVEATRVAGRRPQHAERKSGAATVPATTRTMPPSSRPPSSGGRDRGPRPAPQNHKGLHNAPSSPPLRKPPPPPPPATAQESFARQQALKHLHNHGDAALVQAAFAPALIPDLSAGEAGGGGGRGGRGKGGRGGRGGRGKGGRGGKSAADFDALPPDAPAAAPAAAPPAADIGKAAEAAIEHVIQKMDDAALHEAERVPSAAELGEAERLRQERKEKKKLRRQSSMDGKGGGGGAVLPSEPNADAITGDRRCRSPADFVTLCKLGEGAFGRVMLVRWRGDGRACAMKVVRMDDASSSASMTTQILAERRVLIELSEQPHPLISSVLCCFRSAKHLHFVMPLLPGGTLARLLSSQPQQVLPEEWARFYTAQLALALGALHSRRMLYLDLKLENVMLSASGDATLVDFGFVRCDIDIANGQSVKRAGGTRGYSAPEAILSQPVSAPCDWWALGILVRARARRRRWRRWWRRRRPRRRRRRRWRRRRRRARTRALPPPPI